MTELEICKMHVRETQDIRARIDALELKLSKRQKELFEKWRDLRTSDNSSSDFRHACSPYLSGGD